MTDLNPSSVSESMPPMPPLKKKLYSSEMGRLIRFFGWSATALSFIFALMTFSIIADITPFAPTTKQINIFFYLNIILISLLAFVILWQAIAILRERKAGVAGSNLNARIIALFALVSVIPAGFVAVIASMTIERMLEPWFSGDIKVLIEKTQEVANSFRSDECSSLGALVRVMGADIKQNTLPVLARNRPSEIKIYDREEFRKFFTSRATELGFSTAMLLDDEGNIQELFRNPKDDVFVPPPSPQSIMEDAVPYPEVTCMFRRNESIYHMAMNMPELDNWTLYVAREVRKHALAFRLAADRGVQSYYALEERNAQTQSTLAKMFFLITATLLLTAIWIGLSFANTLMHPVRRLIQATDQVASGNYYVQVPVRPTDGDLAHLSETFNKMTRELRYQHDSLTEANSQIDKRRRFTEAVLSGVSSIVISIDRDHNISTANPSAEMFLQKSSGELIGHSLSEVSPELSSLIQEARLSRNKAAHQIVVMIAGKERILNVQIAEDQSLRNDSDLVLTIDDITDLVSAQRTSAWADVARRIAHEIKNPLTPIQLSAERIRRKYGKMILEDRNVFDQCTDTIIRQVDDIKRMVDEFSSFARMPKPTIEQDNLIDTVRQTVFLTRVGYPDITFLEHYPSDRIIISQDRRLISQALTNILKNACEAIGEISENSGSGEITVSVDNADDHKRVISIYVDDNGKGFPQTGRQKLLEPYMTTRNSGTGLGLAIVAKIMEEHNGGIELLDNPAGKGGRVRLWFSC